VLNQKFAGLANARLSVERVFIAQDETLGDGRAIAREYNVPHARRIEPLGTNQNGTLGGSGVVHQTLDSVTDVRFMFSCRSGLWATRFRPGDGFTRAA
jgi:hypothetical protein